MALFAIGGGRPASTDSSQEALQGPRLAVGGGPERGAGGSRCAPPSSYYALTLLCGEADFYLHDCNTVSFSFKSDSQVAFSIFCCVSFLTIKDYYCQITPSGEVFSFLRLNDTTENSWKELPHNQEEMRKYDDTLSQLKIAKCM